ncbi:MAG: sarcosine oxidase subunit delta [Parasphingorhabdus sp.]|jgi:sarcosine oxidase subunit delta|tara:strand:- start:122 stop:418 length:297 start_codon:yes stop_codon:yes gene_type:complete
MKLLTCPLNGPRNISEFTYGGEFHLMPDQNKTDARQWAEYVFFHDNAAGVVTEWWCHTASTFWFLAERNTITDQVIRTFEASEVFSQRKARSVIEDQA